MERLDAQASGGIPAPDWIDAEPDAWPIEIRRAYSLMARIALRIMSRAQPQG